MSRYCNFSAIRRSYRTCSSSNGLPRLSRRRHCRNTSMLADERSKYEAFWNELGKSIKGGLFMDYRNTEKLQDLLIFESSHSTEQKATLQGYVDRMPEQQNAIYYTAGESRAAIEKLP